jgi:biopolymer transport protein ExbD
MLRKPSRKNFKYKFQRPNLIPILDAVFIFIFFLLFSADFVNLFEINSNVPIVSDSPPPKKIPLNLTLRITSNSLTLKTGLNGRVVRSFRKSGDNYDLRALHQSLIEIKKQNINERTIIFEPTNSVD